MEPGMLPTNMSVMLYFSSSSANAPVFIMASGVAVVMMSALEPKSAALFAKGSTQEVIVPA